MAIKIAPLSLKKMVKSGNLPIKKRNLPKQRRPEKWFQFFQVARKHRIHKSHATRPLWDFKGNKTFPSKKNPGMPKKRTKKNYKKNTLSKGS